MRARPLIALGALALAVAALALLRSRSAADAPRSLSATPFAPTATGASAPDPAALAGVRRIADTSTSDAPLIADGAPALDAVGDAAAAPRAEARVTGLVRYTDDQTPAANIELELQQGEVSALARTDAEGRFDVAANLVVGVVDVRHRPDEVTPLQLRFDPETVTLAAIPASPAAPNERVLELWLARPEAVLVVDTFALDGAAVAGAVVLLELLSVGPTGVERPSIDRATTDERGRARLAVYDLAEVRAAGVIARLEAPAAERDRGRRGVPGAPRLTSPFVRLDTPLHAPTLARPVRLVLDAPATVVVHVTAPGGAPLAGHAVRVEDSDPDLWWWLGGAPITDERGEALVVGLPAGRHELSLFGEPDVAPRELALVAGERAEVDFVVVEPPALDFAASGLVLDEEGRPLAGREVSARVFDGAGRPRTIESGTDAEGRFELRAAPAERLVVSASAALFGDEYEPRELEAPFGARGLVFRRTRVVPMETVVFEVVDAHTGELVRDVLVMTYRAVAPGDYAFHGADEGRARPRCALHADTTCLLEAPGYRRRAVLAVDLTAPTPEGEVPRVTLQPGVLRTLRVVDARGRPVVGAAVSKGSTALGSTDAEGLFEVDLTTWPEEGLVVTAEAYTPATWKPRDGFADLGPAEVVLGDLASPGG